MSTAHQYSIRPLNAAAHLFEVTLTVAAPDKAGQIFAVPAWIPGSYMIRDYARNIVAIRAESDGVGVELKKLDKSRWQAAAVERPLTLVLEVFAHDESVRGAHLDTTHAYFNGPCVFPAVVDQEDVSCVLDIQPGDVANADRWRVATSMQRAGADPYGYGLYTASDYAELIDHPVEIGNLNIGEFEACGIPHSLVIRGDTRADMPRLCHDLKVVCEYHLKTMGAPKDLDRYVFLMHAPGAGYGGLEHRWSSSLICSRDKLPIRGEEGVSADYRTFLGLVSHEYFHLWNVKRMKPAVFTPFDLSQETYTELLWVFEGITSYYDDLALVRSGLITTEDYLLLLGEIVTRVLQGEGRRRQSVADSSFDAWTKFYKQDANSRNAIVSYYAKGALIALALDLKLRAETDDRISLDDVFQVCWQRYGETGEGLPEEGLESVAAELSGLDLADFFDAAVRGTGELPLESLLQKHGIEFVLRRSVGRSDKGGTKGDDSKAATVWFGATLVAREGRAMVANVANNSPAEKAGVSPGDELLALDNVRVNADSFDSRVRRYRPGDQSRLTVFRSDELLALKMRWETAPVDTCFLQVGESEDDKARAKVWLGV